MRNVLLSITFLGSISAFARPGELRAEAVYYHDEPEAGSLVLKGDIAEKMYEELEARPVLLRGDPDFESLRKTGQSITCHRFTKMDEYQCLINIGDRSAGDVSPAK